MRCRSARKIEHYFVDVTPAPPFRRIKGFDDRVFCRVKMFCSVSIWRLIATTDMATAAADPQMQPGVAQFQTFFTPQGARNNVADCREMFAKHRRVFLTRNPFRQHIHENRFSVREREGIVMLMRRVRFNRAKSGNAKACHTATPGSLFAAKPRVDVP
jgi:hypothetical protein